MPTETSGIYFDATEVALDFEFIESLTLTKCTLSGKPEPFRLLPHQKKLIANLMGWKRAGGARLYRRCYFSTARKNSKTQTAAALGLLLLCDPNEQSPEIYIAARDRDQASFCFQAAADMVAAHDELREMLSVIPYSKTIRNPANGGVLKALSSEGKSKHGSNPSAVIFDELHAWGEREQELYDALTTGSAARREPLILFLTTAGTNEHSLCRREYDYAQQVKNRIVEDPTYLPLIWELPKDADWTDESLWPLANPALGQIVQLESLREDAVKALAVPSEQNSFRRLHLNQWTEVRSAWIRGETWDACASADFDLESLREYPCYGGLDLASNSDLTAFVLAWPVDDKVYCYPWFFISGHELAARSRRDGVRYDLWAENKLIELTPSETTDWRFVVARILQLAQKFKIRSIGFDRFGARDTAAALKEEGLDVQDCGQGFLSMSAPSKRLEALALSKKLVHSGHQILRWNLSCTTIASDAAGNVKPDKPNVNRSSKRIDGIVALAMALDRIMRRPPENPPSIYESRGLRRL